MWRIFGCGHAHNQWPARDYFGARHIAPDYFGARHIARALARQVQGARDYFEAGTLRAVARRARGAARDYFGARHIARALARQA